MFEQDQNAVLVSPLQQTVVLHPHISSLYPHISQDTRHTKTISLTTIFDEVLKGAIITNNCNYHNWQVKLL